MYSEVMVRTYFFILYFSQTISCLDTPVRLVGGATEYEGRLEIYYNETWGTVCDDDIDDKLSAVVCRSLGLPWVVSEVFCCARYGKGSGPIWLDNVNCVGTEARIEDCGHNAWGSHNCHHNEDVSIGCYPAKDMTKLVGGQTMYEGRLEVRHNGSWGTVCDDDWNKQNTDVVCTSHGFSPEGAVIVHGQPFGPGTGHILMDDVRCWGNESSILQCQHSGWGNHNCEHSKDVSINCTSHKNITTRIVGGPSPYEGRVEVYRNGYWGTLCSDLWNSTDASVVCRSLGYAWQNASGTCCSLYERMSGPDHCVKVRCNGLEDGLNQCDQTDAKNSYCWQYDVSVKCLSDILQILEFKSSSLVFREGASAWFDLQIQSNAAYQIRWFHNEDLITSSSTRYRITSFEHENGTSSHTLQVNNVLLRDKGDWKIKVINLEKYATRNLTIKVIPRLVLEMKPKYDFSIPSGDDIHLQCTINNPESLLNVTQGGLILKKDETTISEQKRCEGQISDGISWNTTLAGNTKYEHCPANQRGMASRKCRTSGLWESPSLINCTTEVFINASTQLDGIIEDGIRNTEKIRETVSSTLQMMKNLTSSTNQISAGDLSSSLDIFEKIVHVSNSTGSHIEKKAFYDVIDNVLSTNNTKSWTTVSKKTEKDASSLLSSMERLSEVVIQNDNITSTQFTGSNFELSIDNRKIDETGIRFPDVASTNDSENVEERSTYLELPKQEAKVEKAINYVAVIYKTMSEIMPSDCKRDQKGEKQEDTFKEEEFVNSQILSLTTQSDLGVLVPPLNLTFRHIQNNKPAEMQVLCVSWNFTDSEWTEEGCKVNHSDHETTVCQCNHLTNFAILMRPYSPEAEDEQSLKTMSLVGVILSVTFTAITLLIYILTWKNIKSEQNIIMLNLCGSLILAYVIFISAVEQTSNKGVCIAITATLHYLFLVTFFSMLGMGVYYFMSITVTYYAMYVANNFKSKSRGHWFLLGIWGIPVLITVTSLGAFWGENNYHLKSYCWLSMESGSLYAFIVPVCVIAILNLLVIVSLVRVLCASSAMTKSSLQKKAISGLRSLGTLLPVLGVTWLFGILAVNENADVFQYIFVITNSFQGIFIFVSHVLLNRKVMQGLKNKYPAFSSLISIAEHSKKETSSISRDTSTSATNVHLIKIKKRSIFDGLRRLTTTIKNIEEKDFESLVTEKTISTDCSLSVSHEKTLVESQNTSKLEPEAGKASTERRFRFSINLNPWTKRYRVAQM
eukprot:XP_019928435.1 PREDICTED: latrophilin Cirl isoform X2 [Crassostrea gigas]